MPSTRTALTPAYPIPFGRYRGTAFRDLPEDYLRWLQRECKSPTLRELAARVLDCDQPESDEADVEPSDVLAAQAMPWVVFQFEQNMREHYAADPDALEIVAYAVDELKRHCSRYTRRPFVA